MKNKKERKSKIEKIDFIIFFMILIVFGIALLGFYPAIMTSDCVDQMGQAETGNYRASHPIFHTAIIGNIAKNIWYSISFCNISNYCFCNNLDLGM